ncbi:helix-turn-helix domain-containing protein [Streptomyces lonarensis]|uniref:Helix-turn-helix domain-containing protein n=2 Tax=Streptomyces lonarensis TaxID=700599 RepID=A0A7X6CX72_9ACTN|nr:helix-turn-helix domain-containing protein [Streptomyces lonarensis]
MASANAPAPLGSLDLQGFAAILDLLAQAGGMNGLPGAHRAPETKRLHLGYDEAAERLNIPEKWLRERISTLPHRKLGKFVQFTEDDLRAISDMHFVNPGKEDQKSVDPKRSPLQPSRRSRRNP